VVGRARDGGSCRRDGGGAGGWVLGVVVVEGWNNATLMCHVSRDMGRPIRHRVSTTADVRDVQDAQDARLPFDKKYV